MARWHGGMATSSGGGDGGGGVVRTLAAYSASLMFGGFSLIVGAAFDLVLCGGGGLVDQGVGGGRLKWLQNVVGAIK